MGQVNDVGFGSDPRERRSGPGFHVTGYSRLLEGLCKIMQPRVAHGASVRLAVQAACRGGGVMGGGRAGLACWSKKGLLCCVVNMDGLEAQAEGGKTPKLNSVSNNASHPSAD